MLKKKGETVNHCYAFLGKGAVMSGVEVSFVD